jgi:hypothetical protein
MREFHLICRCRSVHSTAGDAEPSVASSGTIMAQAWIIGPLTINRVS